MRYSILIITTLLPQLIFAQSPAFVVTPGNTSCVPATFIFTNVSSGATSYRWSFGDGTSSTSTDGSHTYNTAGVYAVELTAYSGGDSAKEVRVIHAQGSPNPNPTVSSSSVCPGKYVEFNTGLDEYPDFLEWTFGDSSADIFNSSAFDGIQVQYVEAGIYNVHLVAGNVCDTDTAYVVVTVSTTASGTAEFTGYENTVCVGEPVLFQSTSSSDISSFVWDFDDGSSAIEEHPVHSFSAAGSYNVELIANNGCVNDTVIHTIIVDDAIVPTIDISGNTQICLEDELQLTAVLDNVDSLIWDFGDGVYSIKTAPKHKFDAVGTYLVILKAFSYCDTFTSDTLPVIVGTNLIQPTSVTLNYDTACIGYGISCSFDDNGYTSWLWEADNGDSSSERNAIFNFSDVGTHEVRLEYTNACDVTDSLSVEVVITDNLPLDISITYPKAACIGEEVFFENSSDINASYYWNLGTYNDDDTATAYEMSYIFDSVADYRALLTAITSCGTFYKPFAIEIGNDIDPVASFSISENPTCVGSEIIFTNTSSKEASWEFGDGFNSTDFSPTHTFLSSNSFNVKMNIQNACGEVELVKSIFVNNSALADFSFDNVCFPDQVEFTNESVGSAHSYYWDFGDGGFSGQEAGPNYSYTAPGSYDVSLQLKTGGCESIAEHKVHVNDPSIGVDANFSYRNSGLTYYFRNESSNSSSWTWNFGDGNISYDENPEHTFSKVNTYKVVLEAESACLEAGDEIKDTIVKYVNPLGLANVIIPNTQLTSIQVYPNPVTNWLNLEISSESENTLQLYIIDVLGETEQQEKRSIISGSNKISLDASSLSQGVHFLYIIDREGFKSVIPIIKN